MDINPDWVAGVEDEQLAAHVARCTQYEHVYRMAQAAVEHELDREDKWRNLTREELIRKLMLHLRAGIEPAISNAVVKTGREALEQLKTQDSA